jgi:tyrosinase
MPDERDAQQRLDDLLLRPKERGQPSVMAAGAAPPRAPFSAFRRSDVDEALALAATFHDVFERAGGGAAGSSAVIDEYERALASRDPALVKYALQVFSAHEPDFSVRVRTNRELLKRVNVQDAAAGGAASLTAETAPDTETAAPEAAPEAEEAGARPAAPGEKALDYYRNDIDLSDHHDHWHTIYPTSADARHPAAPEHGRLFLYMHQQMLARYDTDRHAAGLDPVAPYAATFGAYGELLPPARRPRWVVQVRGDDFIDRDALSVAEAWKDAGDDSDYEAQRKRFKALSSDGYDDAETLGLDIEGCGDGTTGASDLHNAGHMLIAQPPGQDTPTVMADTAVAITDPVFFRWHRRVDGVMYEWQQRQDPNAVDPDSGTLGLDGDFASVTVRGPQGDGTDSPDLFVTAWPLIEKHGGDYTAFADRFANGAWDLDPSDPKLAPFVSTTLRTKLVRDPDSREQLLTLADHFVYYLRLENAAHEPRTVVARIFLAADEVLDAQGEDDRRFWIEMDKFTVTVPAAKRGAPGRIVAARPSWHSTVVRNKSVLEDKNGPLPPPGTPDALQAGDGESDKESRSWCDCGLPYRLLLPRGRPDGMAFTLALILTNGDDIDPGAVSDDDCGSVSYCGRQALQKKEYRYPDSRSMGYPFDRRLADAKNKVRGTLDVLREANNVALRSLTIVDATR